MRKQTLLFSGLALVLLGLAMIPIDESPDRYHSRVELALLQEMLLNPPVDTNLYFGTSSHCYGCHSTDFNEIGLVDSDGNDVAMFEDWSSSMMANSAKDPFWRAKVSHESVTLPEHADAIQNTCTTCHAPMGHYTAAFHGELPYTMSDLLADTLGLDGVSCSVCHMMSEQNLGDQHSGAITFDTTDRVLYGPFPIPYAPPMQLYVGFEPLYSEHILDAGICAPCHTLITGSFDLDGNPTGSTFVEQATYHEWLNSTYNVNDVSCGRCHLPHLTDSVLIASNYNFLEKRFPYGQHDMVGANTFMLQLMRDARFELGLLASEDAFNETIDKTFDMLQNQTLVTSLEMVANQGDTAYFEFYLENQAGHKFPSGYPSRRAFVEFVLETENGDTIFHSGAYDEQYNIPANDPNYEPHYDMINDPEQVQIYEFVAGDINGDFTTVLEHMYSPLKDNRLPPIGFFTNTPIYDTCRIIGTALSDPNFNRDPGEGSGSDRILFAVSLEGYSGLVSASARVYYQSLPRRWVEPMFEVNTPEIDQFKGYYEEADHSPVLIDEQILEDTYVEGMVSSVSQLPETEVSVYPNPSWSGRFFLDWPEDQKLMQIELWDATGRKLRFHQPSDNEIWIGGKGTFILRITTDQGYAIRKVLVH